MKSFVLKGQIFDSHNRTEIKVWESGYAVCVDGASAGVFDALPDEYARLPVIDCGDQLIIPGMVDLHIHAPQYAYRGLGMDLELLDWLNEQAFPEESKYEDLDYARKAYAIFADALRQGATTRACILATQHRPATELLMELMEQSGIVSYVGKVNMDRDAPDDLREESAEISVRETSAWIAAVNDKFQNTKPILTPRFIPSCTDELMEKLGKIRSEYDLPVQSHLSENQGEIKLVGSLRPQDSFYGEGYDKYGLFGKDHTNHTEVKTVMAHCVWSSEEEIALMKDNGVFVAHCPASNMNVSSGIAPVRTYLDGGLRVGLGSDIAAGQSDSVFRAMTDAIQVSKLYWRMVDQSVRPLTFPEVFYMATRGGGQFFGRVGSFEAGYEFDAVVLDDSCIPHPQPLSAIQRLERAVYLQLDMKGITAKFVRGQRLF